MINEEIKKRLFLNHYQIEKLLLEVNCIEYKDSNKNINFFSNIDFLGQNASIEDIDNYFVRNKIRIPTDILNHILTNEERTKIDQLIEDKFTNKNAKCDQYDYMIAGTCGLIGGLIDILFVGMPGASELGDFTDEQANKITENFAEFLGWDKNKAIEKGSNTTTSAIGFLEKTFKVNYDQASTNGRNGTGGLVENLLPKNHHLKSVGHSPDIIGLFFSILNQFTNTSTFISNGKIITIETKESEINVVGHNFVAKIFCGFANWFGHILSDWTGSSGAIGRGSGVPIPFYNLFQMINIGEFGQHKQTFATITTKVFEEGYDFRHCMAMAIPVVITELLIRFMYTMKSHFYHKKNWTDSLPKGNIPELRRMLLVGHGTLCLVDGADAIIKSGGEIVQTLLRTNLVAWVRFSHLSLKEVYALYKSGKINNKVLEEFIKEELEILSKDVSMYRIL